MYVLCFMCVSYIQNIFRLPLNLFVVVLLLKIKYLSSQTVFTICTATHGLAFLCYLYFYSHQHRKLTGGGSGGADGDYDLLGGDKNEGNI